MDQKINLFTDKQIKRFWSRVEILSSNECWEWQSRKNSKGYGKIGLVIGGKKKDFLAHRISFTLSNSVSLETIKLHVLHSCDNPCCCNPNHLSLGDDKENVRQMVERGRNKHGNQKGEDHSQRKLTWSDVYEIRLSNLKYAELSLQYKISVPQVSRIKNGIRWKGQGK